MATKMTEIARKNYEAIQKVDVADIVAKGRAAAEAKDWDLAASYVAGLAYPALAVYENRRKLAWQYARNHFRYGQCFDDVCHSTLKLKAVYDHVSHFINPPSWLKRKESI